MSSVGIRLWSETSVKLAAGRRQWRIEFAAIERKDRPGATESGKKARDGENAASSRFADSRRRFIGRRLFGPHHGMAQKSRGCKYL